MTENKKPNNPFAFAACDDMAFIQHGMTLRDYFANSAMQGILNNGLSVTEEHAKEAYAVVAEQSYLLADAMLKQREL